MSSPEPSIPAAEADGADGSTTTFITDLSIGSLFTKALIIVLFVFFLIRLCYIIVRRFCHGHHDDQNHYPGNIVPNSNTTVNPNDQHDEGNVRNDAMVTTGVVVDVDVAISSYPSFMYSAKIGAAAGNRDNTICPICICEYVDSEMMRMMSQCGHYFHLKCLDEWLKINWSCPVCRDSPSLQQAMPSTCN